MNVKRDRRTSIDVRYLAGRERAAIGATNDHRSRRRRRPSWLVTSLRKLRAPAVTPVVLRGRWR
jgi:hypothetical protein